MANVHSSCKYRWLPEYRVDPDDVGYGHEEEDEEEEEGGAVHAHPQHPQHHPGPPEHWCFHYEFKPYEIFVLHIC